MNRMTFPPPPFSRAFYRLEVPGGVMSPGMKSAGFWIFSGWGVPFVRFHIGPVTIFVNNSHPKVFCIGHATVSIRLTSVSVWRSFFIRSFLTQRDLSIRVDLDDVIFRISWDGNVSAVSLGRVFFPLRMSRRISSHLPYFPSRPRMSVENNGLEITFRWFVFPVSVFTVFSVPLTAVCILSEIYLLGFFGYGSFQQNFLRRFGLRNQSSLLKFRSRQYRCVGYFTSRISADVNRSLRYDWCWN